MKSGASPCPLDQISIIAFRKSPVIRSRSNAVAVLAYKNGSPKDPSNFRSISIEPVLPKGYHSIIRNRLYNFVYHLKLREKPYFPSPGISLRARKDQVNIIFPSNFWFKKGRISHHRKVQNKDFSVISKYHISINFLAQKYHIFHLQKIQNKNFLVISKHDIPC